MKILIISHNPLNPDECNGRTLMELFAGHEKHELAQLFIHRDAPDFSVCDNYYRVTDFDVLNGLKKLRRPGGPVSPTEQAEGRTQAEQEAYDRGSRRRSFTIFARNAMWGLGTWFTPALRAWLRDFAPDVIFCYVGDYRFSIKMTLKIAKFLRVPIVNYIVDDFYLNRKLWRGFFGFLNGPLYSRAIRRLLNGRHNIFLTDTARRAYAGRIRGQLHTLYTTSSLTPFGEKPPSLPLRMSYLGNLGCDRFRPLCDIGRVIAENGLPIDFRIYSGDTRERHIAPLLEAPGLSFCGKLDYTAVKQVMEESDVLVHVEDFAPANMAAVRYSLSTKIADSLACGRCLLAYGPDTVASMEYLRDNGCALVAGNRDELTALLSALCKDPDRLAALRERALAVAAENHSAIQNRARIAAVLEAAVKEAQAVK